MTKTEFVRALMDEHKIMKTDAVRIVDMVFGQVKKQLMRGSEVRIDGVGRFVVRYKEAGMVNNNLLGKKHKVGPRVKLKFLPFPSMRRDLVKALKE